MRPMSIQDQPPPRPGEGDLWRRVIDSNYYSERVVALMEERRRLGIERYGTPLQAHNGRDALVDALQEALDLRVYLEQMCAEHSQDVSPRALYAHINGLNGLIDWLAGSLERRGAK